MSEWPKKMPVSAYAKRWYVSRCKQSVINDIQRGNLPGEKEPNGNWFVWVNSDQTPAHSYRPPVMSKPTAGATLAQQILAKHTQLKAAS